MPINPDAQKPAVICLVTPVFNDWAPLTRLLAEIDGIAASSGFTVDVVVVNDASTGPGESPLDAMPARHAIAEVTILDLRANIGNQLAIAVGLNYAQKNRSFDALLTMDSDGEDQPADIARLVAAWRANPGNLIVAERTKRSETKSFKMMYRMYRWIFYLLTGRSISFGNFALTPAALLPILLSRPELIHHFAATLLRTRLPITRVPTVRGTRYGGVSQMNTPALVLVAIGALSVFSDVLFSRLLIAAALLGLACGAGAGFVTIIRLFTDLAFPNWATTVIGFLTLLAAQAVILILCTGFLLLTSRALMLLTSLETSKLIQRVRAHG